MELSFCGGRATSSRPPAPQRWRAAGEVEVISKSWELAAASAAASAALLTAATAVRGRQRRRERRKGSLLDGLLKLKDFSPGGAADQSGCKLLITPLPGAGFGATVSGIDLGDPTVLSVKETRLQLRRALATYGLLVFNNQDLVEEDVVRAAEVFGQPARAPGQPMLLATYRVLDRDRVQRGQDFWHSDNSYMAIPGGPTMLYSVKVPKDANGRPLGDTLFLDAEAAVARLPEDLRRKLEGRRAQHNIAYNNGIPIPEYVSGEWQELPDALHPVLRRNPDTGREVLFLSPAYVRCIEGLPEEESALILREVFQIMLDPATEHRHKWQEDQLVVWDNGRLLHKATTLEMPPGAERLMWRVQSLPFGEVA